MTTISNAKLPQIVNEPNGSEQRDSLDKAIEEAKAFPVNVPLVIGGQEVRTSATGVQVNPANHQTIVATYHKAGAAERGRH
ncbi:Delta-1-pyrroline-5-carboxylate dehydrogenase [Tolypocladium paradoxum]|uniref:Delta-1-pyrroline-5-carboxylate dehydrogenase n=1 Tax=Tolypocladium paradoxum TaxID=94208 RepID=A0A2S4KY57_9HYPO|nr:Delta-1-pyrroline-5-carboxylate dehydrogenase [Tolypocladium paradoxum]